MAAGFNPLDSLARTIRLSSNLCVCCTLIRSVAGSAAREANKKSKTSLAESPYQSQHCAGFEEEQFLSCRMGERAYAFQESPRSTSTYMLPEQEKFKNIVTVWPRVSASTPNMLGPWLEHPGIRSENLAQAASLNGTGKPFQTRTQNGTCRFAQTVCGLRHEHCWFLIETSGFHTF
jgi:hypothetical protein